MKLKTFLKFCTWKNSGPSTHLKQFKYNRLLLSLREIFFQPQHVWIIQLQLRPMLNRIFACPGPGGINVLSCLTARRYFFRLINFKSNLRSLKRLLVQTRACLQKYWLYCIVTLCIHGMALFYLMIPQWELDRNRPSLRYG